MYPLSGLFKTFVRIGTLNVIDANGKTHTFAGKAGPEAAIRISDPSLYYRMFFNPELCAGEAYMDGSLSVVDGTLRDFLKLYAINSKSLENHPMQRIMRGISMTLRRLQQDNRASRARRNVAHHYDLGNAFYRLFLDDDMHYSCAYFESEDDTLEEAQRNKLRLIASKMNLQPGNRVLDIGSGWGGMGIYLATLEDVEVLGITLSTEQCELANQRARDAGVADRVRFEIRDYRDVDETFDRIVSVGMFEHVGARHYRAFFDMIKDVLHKDGVAMLHSIGHMAPPNFTNAWLRKYIFPGGYCPALSEVLEAVEPTGLWINDMEILRLHYARTLREWNRRFQANREAVAAMYDEKFCRMWEFYLYGTELVFEEAEEMVFQIQLAHKRDAVPITRDYIAERQRAFRDWEAEREAPIRQVASYGD